MAKWLPDISPSDRAVDVAARTLHIRLDAVRRYLRRSAEEPGNPDNIHQFRVWTRRADAAVALYADLLPRRRREKLRKVLRKLRRAAGRVRDCDVFADRNVRPGNRWPAALRAERDRAQRKLVDLCEKLGRGRRLKRQVARLLGRMIEREAGNRERFADRARNTLGPIAAAFFDAYPGEAGADEELHRFRIAGKRLRYAMEMLAAAFPPVFREELYPVLGILQEKLGRINDLSAGRDRHREGIDRTGNPAELSDLQRKLAETEEDLAAARASFRSWWTPQARDGFRARFDEMRTPPANC